MAPRPSSRACATRTARRTSSTPPRWPGITVPPVNVSTYAATKHAVVALTDRLRHEVADDGIGVSVLCPGRRREPAVRGAPSRAGRPRGQDHARAAHRGPRPHVARARREARPRRGAAQRRFWVITHPRERERVDERYEETPRRLRLGPRALVSDAADPVAAARREIERLIYHYAELQDAADWDAIAEMFAHGDFLADSGVGWRGQEIAERRTRQHHQLRRWHASYPPRHHEPHDRGRPGARRGERRVLLHDPAGPARAAAPADRGRPLYRSLRACRRPLALHLSPQRPRSPGPLRRLPAGPAGPLSLTRSRGERWQPGAASWAVALVGAVRLDPPDEVHVGAAVEEPPLAVDALEVVVVAARDDRFERERVRALEDRVVRLRRG